MNTNEKLTKFQDELGQRKYLLNNRIIMLMSSSPDANANRIAQLQKEKETIQEVQELFFDYFYNELTTSTDDVPEKPLSMKLEDLIAQTDMKQSVSNEIDKQFINENNNDKAQEEEQEPKARKKPDMKSLFGKLDQIKSKHSID